MLDRKISATRSDFKAKNAPNSISAGATSHTPHGELTTLPRPLAVFNGPTSKKRGRGREGREGKWEGRGGYDYENNRTHPLSQTPGTVHRDLANSYTNDPSIGRERQLDSGSAIYSYCRPGPTLPLGPRIGSQKSKTKNPTEIFNTFNHVSLSSPV